MHDWFKADRARLVSAVSKASAILENDFGDLAYGHIDKFLTTGTIVLRVLMKERDYEAAEQVALFSATAGIGQFTLATAQPVPPGDGKRIGAADNRGRFTFRSRSCGLF